MDKKIYLVSDLHLNHDKEFLYKPRGFETIEEHDAKIIENINSLVGENDVLYSLGDELMGNLETAINKFKQIKCKNICIIRGNHTTDNKLKALMTLDNVVYGGYATMLKYKKWHFYLSHYPTITNNYDDSNKPVKARIINLCGHTHSQDRFNEFRKGVMSYHVELDAQLNYPILIDNIIEDIKGYYNGN